MSPPSSELHQSNSIELQEEHNQIPISNSPPTQPPTTPPSSNPPQQVHKNNSFEPNDHSSMKPKNSNVQIRTCWGVIELSWLRLLSLLSLVVNILAFVILLALMIWSYAAFRDLRTDTIEHTVLARLYRERLSYSSKTAALYSACLASLNVSVVTPPSNTGTGSGSGSCVGRKCKGRSMTEEYAMEATTNASSSQNYELYVSQEAYLFYNTTLLYNQTISNLLAAMSDQEVQALNLTRLDSVDSSIQFEAKAVELALKKNGTQALRVLFSDPTYQTKQSQFLQQVLDPVAFYVSDKQQTIAFVLNVQTVVSLVVILLAVSIVIPVVIATLVCALNRDAIQIERLKKANALMAIDTMRDPQLRKLFKAFCEKEYSVENFLLLEKIGQFKELASKSMEIKMFLYDDSKSTLSDDTDMSDAGYSEYSSMSNTSTKKLRKDLKKTYTESDLFSCEKKKYELAMEIYSEFLDMNGSRTVNLSKKKTDVIKKKIEEFANSAVPLLEDDMFDSIEREIAHLMLDTHRRFKESLAFKKQMKIENINTRIKNAASKTK
ncbi:hypothetical protein C9374_003520 [Naegleria lovaniensis]|uniref:RGS domain-containing protein n=1 Tax=Naegleria lovaniensis TaxID=51637 RepID=A0AA88KJJ7_NAELO|nr:uncharacterized protein C9374_003520 [Naegleria lovaniensis]KAG2385705.1 hypothetical protein C9374_003520 [Naegleria lovaniensis]